MKRLLSALFIAALLILPVSGYAIEEFEFLHIDECGEWVTMREKPSESAKVLTRIPLRALVQYRAEEKNGFTKVQYAGQTGYVQSQYLLENRCECDGPYAVSMYVDHCREFISQRKKATTTSQRVSRLPLGATVTSYGPLDARFDSPRDSMAYVQYSNDVKECWGYALEKYLSFLPPKSKQAQLTKATLQVPGKDGNIFAQTIDDSAGLQALEALLRAATPGEIDNCPIGGQLVLTLRTGETLRFMIPTDTCPTLIAENLSVYEVPYEDMKTLWELFNGAYRQLL